MSKKIYILIFFAPLLFLNPKPAFAQSRAAEYLCEMGVVFYRQGRHEEALQEFRKTLMIDPNNKKAKEYIELIFGKPKTIPAKTLPSTKAIESAKPIEPKIIPRKAETKTKIVKEIPKLLSREEAIELAIRDAGKEVFPEEPEVEERMRHEAKAIKIGDLKVTGEIQASMGIASPGDAIWKRAAFDLNERNWRMLSDAAYNRRFNTYDPRIYDRLNVDLDTENKEGFNFHSEITIDPWSFTGKSAKNTVTTANNDTVEYELKYWSNTGYTVNETIYSRLAGNTFGFGEIKVKHNKTDPFIISGAFWPADSAAVPETKIYRDFQPFRELWVDYNQEIFNFRFFPMAYQDQALISDDPLAITNHHIWWEDSLWLSSYVPGIYNSGVVPVDFTKARWDDSLTFLSRNSEGVYLTALRGAAFNYTPSELTKFSATVATPKHLWQNYEVVDNIIFASRLKHYLFDNFSLGGTFTNRTAFDWVKSSSIRAAGKKVDQLNYVEGIDLGYEFTEGLKAFAEVLASQSYFDLTTPDYKTKSRGLGYYFSIVGRYPRKSIMDLTYGYDEIKLDKTEVFLLKGRFYGAHMDDGFYSSLSTYRNTRNDQFWSRYLTFRRPFEYYYAGLKYPGLKWDEINAIRIGDGIDFGRDVLGLRVEAICENKYENLFDVRNVHRVNGKFIENVVRDELTVYFGDKLIVKGLYIYHKLPKSYGRIDPFMFDNVTGEFAKDYSANPIDDGLNTTLNSGSVGLEYAFLDWLSANGIYQCTNDYSLMYGNFPRGVLNSGQLDNTYYEYDKKYRANQLNVYDQQLFPQPPYPYYNIYKFGLRLLPLKDMEIYLDYTRNEYAVAGQISDNMNHVGIEFAFSPLKKLGFLLKYNYSRWKDLQRLRDGYTKPRGHHNFFTEFRYLPSQFDELILQYGEGNVSPIGHITFDPYGSALTTIDTQHIFRFYYRRKF